jgi:hypothetical protein
MLVKVMVYTQNFYPAFRGISGFMRYETEFKGPKNIAGFYSMLRNECPILSRFVSRYFRL